MRLPFIVTVDLAIRVIARLRPWNWDQIHGDKANFKAARTQIVAPVDATGHSIDGDEWRRGWVLSPRRPRSGGPAPRQ